MASIAFTLLFPFLALFGGSATLPQSTPTKFDLETQNPLAQTCFKNTGSWLVYKRITMALDGAAACIGSKPSNASTDAMVLQHGEGCPLREQFRACLNPTIDPILSCLTGSRKENRLFLDKLADVIVQIKCTANQIKDSSETEGNNAEMCLENKAASIIACDAPFFGKSIILSDYDARECAQLFRSKTCIMEILRTCHSGSRLISMVDMVYDVANSVNNCNVDIGSESIENEI